MESDQRILLVDDEKEVLDTVSKYLSDRGYRVATATKWTEAIAELEETLPDLILLDLDLPTVHGVALLEFIRESHQDLPVVIVSKQVDSGTLDRLSALGANGFVRKPFDAEDLLLVVEQALIDQPAAPPDEPEETPPSSSPGAPAATGRAGVRPGAGAGTLPAVRRSAPPNAKRYVRKRKGGRRSWRFRTYVIAALLCVLIGLMVWALGNTFSSGILGIGFR